MSSLFEANVALLTSRFPGQVTLSYEEVAACLGYTGDNGHQWTRRRIERGSLMPGLKKTEGSYVIPLTTFAEWLASLREPTPPTEVDHRPRIEARPRPKPIRRNEPADWRVHPKTGKPMTEEEMDAYVDEVIRKARRA